MGGSSSTPEPPKPAPEPPLLQTPWREINWRDKEADLQYIKSYKPQTEGQQLRILLHGPIGAGKSSFINSVQSALRGRVCAVALVDNTSGDSFTKQYKTYKVQRDDSKTFYPFVFNDIMGLQSLKGILVDDIKLALSGHVKDDYRFNPESKLSEEDPFYNKSPTAKDEAQVLVCVVPANTLSGMIGEAVQKIKDIRLEASDLDIPQVAIITKVDQACPEISKDLENVYRSKYLKKLMKKFSEEVGIPMNCIFPIKNYSEEINLNVKTDALILSALRRIIDYGEDYVKYKAQ